MNNIESVKFDLLQRSFEITYKGGTVEKYPNLTSEDYNKMVTSENLQRELQRKIRDGITVGVRVAPKFIDKGIEL